MQWQWQSRKGNHSRSNNDAVAIVNRRDFFFAILMDVAERSDSSQRFAQYWTQTIAQCVLALGESLSVDRLLDEMRKQQKQLRTDYLHEIASYGLLIYNKATQEGSALILGDCRLGLELSGNIQWLTQPHTLATAFNTSSVPALNNSVTRHTLTRTLNARRFIEPDLYPFNLPSHAQCLLCTDGYWAEYLNEKTAWEQLSDDASCLRLSHDLPLAAHIESDCVNYFSYELDFDT